jgi:predicted RNA-binding protein YlqC (UPF0109 family)
MIDLIRYLAANIVDYPDDVEINSQETDDGQNLSLKVRDTDLCHIIGRSGRTIKDMRLLLTAVSGKSGKRYLLNIIEEQKANEQSSEEHKLEALDY